MNALVQVACICLYSGDVLNVPHPYDSKVYIHVCVFQMFHTCDCRFMYAHPIRKHKIQHKDKNQKCVEIFIAGL